jgi:3-hydroxyisobutyrate dehydrogenase-like beta-hydroxyacid dehydrogenase
MTPQRVGIIHPGAMGISIAASAENNGHHVYWASEGRSAATAERATKYGLHDAGSLADLCAACTVLISVCPPHAAEAVARLVAGHAFRGLYVDANAVAPRRAVQMGRMFASAGATFVDGGIIGEPAWEPGRTRLYLAGPRAGDVAGLFAAGPLGAHVLGAVIGQASALKMCFAAYTKGTTALLAAILAAAERLQVRDALERQWAHDDAHFPEQVHRRVREVTAKAWRFVGEMDEIAATFRDAGMPGGFHEAAASVYRRLTDLTDTRSTPALDTVLAALVDSEPPVRAL